MIDAVRQSFVNQKAAYYFYGVILLSAISLCLAIFKQEPIFALIPFTFLGALLIIEDYSRLFYLFFALLPFSIEYTLPNGLGTDLPTEPIMWLLTGIGFVLFIAQNKQISAKKYFSTITLLLALHVLWIFVTCFTSENPTISMKFLAAKIWYIVPFYFFPIHLIKSNEAVYRFVRIGTFMLLISVIIVLVRHAMAGFTFEASNRVVQPIFRNHVNYASLIVIFIPYIVLLYSEAKWKSAFITFTMVIMVIATYFSYTRAAILSLPMMVGAYYIIQFRLTKWVLLAVVIGLPLFIGGLLYNNNYLNYAPKFERTVMHKKFDKLLEATTNLEDLSTMERVYRWVAGVEMIKRKPIFGYGPSGFYANYQRYTISSFQTYVSDNPEHSGVHCYYLMTFVEQGVIGFILFLVFCGFVVLEGEKTYHALSNRKDKAVVLAALISFIVVLIINLINDMIETDKVGPFFFLGAGIISLYRYRLVSKQN